MGKTSRAPPTRRTTRPSPPSPRTCHTIRGRGSIRATRPSTCAGASKAKAASRRARRGVARPARATPAPAPYLACSARPPPTMSIGATVRSGSSRAGATSRCFVPRTRREWAVGVERLLNGFPSLLLDHSVSSDLSLFGRCEVTAGWSAACQCDHSVSSVLLARSVARWHVGHDAARQTRSKRC